MELKDKMLENREKSRGASWGGEKSLFDLTRKFFHIFFEKGFGRVEKVEIL